MDSSNKSLIRFTTNQLAQMVEAEGKGWTSSRRILLFEFQNTTKGLRIKLIIGPGESAVREKLYDIASNNTAFRGRNIKLTTAYTTIFVKNILDYNENHEVDPEKLHNDIESRVERFFGKELKTLEKVIWESYDI